MPVRTLANTNLLAYGVSTEPDPIAVSPGVATLNIVVSNPGTNAVTCEDLQIKYTIGQGAANLTDDPGMMHVALSPDTWHVVTHTEGEITLRAIRPGDAVFTDKGLLIKLTGIAVNAIVGTTAVTVRERAHRTGDPLEWRQNDYQLAKFPYGWSFSDFAPKSALVEHGQPAELDWKTFPEGDVPDVKVEIFYGAKGPVDVSAGPPFRSEPLTADTVFVLRATLQIGGDTVQHYQVASVAVANPALTASALTVTGTSGFTQHATFRNDVTVDGTLTAGKIGPELTADTVRAKSVYSHEIHTDELMNSGRGAPFIRDDNGYRWLLKWAGYNEQDRLLVAQLFQSRDGQPGAGKWGGLYLHDGGYKTFVIDHPLRADRYLVHATLEGPEAAVFYRGTAQLVAGRAEIFLPEYADALTEPESWTVQLTGVGGFDRLALDLLDGSVVSKGRFVVIAENPDSAQAFHWEAKGTRRDRGPLDPEPARSDTSVQSIGPYTWLQDNAG